MSKKKVTKKKVSTRLKRKILPVFNTPKRNKRAKALAKPEKVTNPGNGFLLWPDAKCGTCGHDASNDPNGECYAYKFECPCCGKEGCDECMPAGRGCPCPDCEQEDEVA